MDSESVTVTSHDIIRAFLPELVLVGTVIDVLGVMAQEAGALEQWEVLDGAAQALSMVVISAGIPSNELEDIAMEKAALAMKTCRELATPAEPCASS